MRLGECKKGMLVGVVDETSALVAVGFIGGLALAPDNQVIVAVDTPIGARYHALVEQLVSIDGATTLMYDEDTETYINN